MNKPILSDDSPLADRAAFEKAVREGLAAADAGRLTSFEPVADWLASWGTESELLAPK
jgi:predicted transcriptional regulator